MTIELQELGKRFQSQWIFADLNMRFESGDRVAITGPNGSGKSTLLRLLCGASRPSSGKIRFLNAGGAEIEEDQVFRSVSLAAPYTELIEEFTLSEAIQFQRRFMRFQDGVDDSLLTSWLPFGKRKLIREFSSGMKQRLKLVLAICADSELLLLDEPTSNLDKQGQGWYRELLDQFSEGRLIFIASNEEAEYSGFVSRHIDITEFKQARKF